MIKGRFTLPGESGMEKEIKELQKELENKNARATLQPSPARVSSPVTVQGPVETLPWWKESLGQMSLYPGDIEKRD